MNNEIYITLKGGEKVTINDRIIRWSDDCGNHVGKVVDYVRTAERGGSPFTHKKMVFIVCCDDGVRELHPFEMRDIIEKTISR